MHENAANLDILGSATPETHIIARYEDLQLQFQAVQNQLNAHILGQKKVVELCLITLLCGGHGLMIGLPGLAKTKLVHALGASLGLHKQRVQFTPDLMPSDILGAEVLDIDTGGARHFRFIKGPIFCQLLLADEINRASPRTQAALLEAMQEKQVTIAGVSHQLPTPFHVFATQNPIEQEGTYPLPEAQLDRFLFSIPVDYPDFANEKAMLMTTTATEEGQNATIQPLLVANALLEAQNFIRAMPISDSVLTQILTAVRILRPTNQPRTDIIPAQYLEWGAGPRAGQALVMGAKARAFLQGRTTPLLEDVMALLEPALAHRLKMSYTAKRAQMSVEEAIARVRHALFEAA